MRTIITAAAFVALAGAPALSQTSEPQQLPEAMPEQSSPQYMPEDDEPQPDGRLGMEDRNLYQGERGPDGREMRHRQDRPRWSGRRGAQRQMRHGMRGMDRGSGTTIRVQIDASGGSTIIVRCGPQEPARSCADITLDLLDRVNGE